MRTFTNGQQVTGLTMVGVLPNRRVVYGRVAATYIKPDYSSGRAKDGSGDYYMHQVTINGQFHLLQQVRCISELNEPLALAPQNTAGALPHLKLHPDHAPDACHFNVYNANT